MNPYMAYEAVNTKITTRKGDILDGKKLEKMLECTTVEQVTEYLRDRYDLKQVIDHGKSHDLRRDDLETLLKRYVVLEIESILHYLSGPYKDFLQIFLMEFEISDLIMMLRKIASGEPMSGVEKHFVHSENYSFLPYGRLMAATSVFQFIEHLKNTPYYHPLKTITDNDVVKREFHTEMKLQAMFYKILIGRAVKLSPGDRQLARDILGLKIDFLNVQWIYRAKKYYDISPEEMLIYSLQGGKRLGFSRLKKLCYSKTAEEIRHLSNKYLRYGIFITNDEVDIELNIDKYLFAYVKERKRHVNIGTILSYIYMLEIVIKNLVTVTEGIRYQLPKEDLKQYLVHSDPAKKLRPLQLRGLERAGR